MIEWIGMVVLTKESSEGESRSSTERQRFQTINKLELQNYDNTVTVLLWNFHSESDQSLCVSEHKRWHF